MNKTPNIFWVILLCVVSYVGLLISLYSSRESDTWNPQQGYAIPKGGRASESSMSVGSNGNGVAVPMTSRHSSALFSSKGRVRKYPTAFPQTPSSFQGGTTGAFSSPISHMSSSQTMKSFGGGGTGGGVSMSGGQVNSSGSSVVSSGLNISMSSTSMYAYNTNRNSSSALSGNMMSFVPVDIAMPSSQAYAGISNTARGISGRYNAPPSRDPYDVWLEWLRKNGQGYGELAGTDGGGNIYNWNYENAWDAFCAWFSMAYPGSSPEDYTGADAAILWEQWLSWFMSNNGTHKDSDGNIYNFLPIGDYLSLLVMAVLYIGYIAIRRRNKWENINTLS